MIGEIYEHIPEGMTIIFEAPQRWGKSLAMVLYGLDAYQHDKKIFSNIQLAFPHEPLEFVDVKLADGKSRFYNGHVMIDELNFYFDARRSMSGPNLEFGSFLLQQKKQGCSITGTTHNLMYLDVRLRDNYDYIIRPSVRPKFPKVPEVLRIEIDNGPLQEYKHKVFKIPCKQFLSLYDTKAVYDPFKHKRKKLKDEEADKEWLAPPKRRRGF